MPLSPDPETSFVKLGDVMCEGVTSHEEAAWLRNEVADEEQRLAAILARNDSILKLTGVAAMVMALDRHSYEVGAANAAEDVAEAYGVSRAAAKRMIEEDGGGPIQVNASTQFRVAENILETEPCDPGHETGRLYVVIHNDSLDPYGTSKIAVGSRETGTGEGEDVYSPAVPGVPGDLYLAEQHLAVVGSLVDVIKREMRLGKLSHLGRSGYYDTLVVQGFKLPEVDCAESA